MQERDAIGTSEGPEQGTAGAGARIEWPSEADVTALLAALTMLALWAAFEMTWRACLAAAWRGSVPAVQEQLALPGAGG